VLGGEVHQPDDYTSAIGPHPPVSKYVYVQRLRINIHLHNKTQKWLLIYRMEYDYFQSQRSFQKLDDNTRQSH
jgi:hypothetical protein